METNAKIRKIAEGLARELDIKITDIKEMLDVTDDIPHQCGVYIITTIMSYKKYIGSTKDLRCRIQGHKLRPYVRIIDVYLIENIEDARIMEDLLICDI